MATAPTKKTEKKEPISRAAAVLGENLTALMEASKDYSSNPKVHEKTKLSTATVSRIRNGLVNANLETLELLAGLFDLEPWQMLVPGLVPSNPPVMGIAGQREKELYSRIMSAAKEIVKAEK